MRRLFCTVVAIALVAVGASVLWRSGTPDPGGSGSAGTTLATDDPGRAGDLARQPGDPPAPANLPAGTRAVPGARPDLRFTRLDDGRSIANEGYDAVRVLHQEDLPPEEDLERLDMVMNLYKWAYKAVPEGADNYEIMAGLTGANPHGILFFPPDHPHLDDEGNLLDRWGRPYFFHKLTDQLVDITSAGPDGRMGTNDDFTLGFTQDYEDSLGDES